MSTEVQEKPVTLGELLSLATSCCANIQLMVGYAANNGTVFGSLASQTTDNQTKASFSRLEADARRWLEETVDKLYSVMQYLGDELDAVDCVCAESSEATRYAFEAMERYRAGRYGGDRMNEESEDYEETEIPPGIKAAVRDVIDRHGLAATSKVDQVTDDNDEEKDDREPEDAYDEGGQG